MKSMEIYTFETIKLPNLMMTFHFGHDLLILMK